MQFSSEREARRIFGQRAAHYATSAAHTDEGVLARVVAQAKPRPNWTALDIATGTGHTAFALAPHLVRVIATDITWEMIAEGEKLRARNALHNVQFGIADAHDLPFSANTFDLVTSRRAPHHFSTIHRAIEEMRRTLKPAGRLVIDDRSVPEDDFVDHAMNCLDTWHDASHVRQYRPSEWARMLDEHGFAVESCELYVQSRPLTSLTKDVAEDVVAKIHGFLAGLNEERQALLGYGINRGEPYINHWYVLIAAEKK